MLLRITPSPYRDGMGDPRRQLGAFLGALRRIRGLSRYELAQAMGVKYPYLANIENGQRPLTPPHREAVASALGLHVRAVENLASSAEADRAAGGTPSLPGVMDAVIEDLSPGLEGWQVLELRAAKERTVASGRQTNWDAALDVARKRRNLPPGELLEEPLSLGPLPRLRPIGLSPQLAKVLTQLTDANRERLTAYAEGLLASQQDSASGQEGDVR